MNKPDQKYLTMAVPRYTSYPTVPHFSACVGASEYERWLARLDPDMPISLYLHVPFCRQLCWYCGCNMKLASRDEPVAEYARTLMAEIALLADSLPARMKVSHLHWGGGTPTALVPDDLERVMTCVRKRFDLLADAEIAIESDPRTLSAEMIARIGALGFKRASFGVQEFDPKVQAAINRVQPPEMVSASVAGLRAAGVRNINFDLIYGLPHQTVNSLLNTIALCADIRPDRLALFGYAHVPWMAKKQRLIPTEALPGPTDRLEQAERAAEALQRLGYQKIGLDHFALPTDSLALAARTGGLRRNFQGYTTDKATTLLGLGSTSIGRTPEGYVQNLAETGAWSRAVLAGVLPVGKGHAFTPDDKMRGEIIERLMCFGEVDLADVAKTYPELAGGFEAEWLALEDLAQDGVVSLQNSVLRVPDHSQSLLRIVACVFDSYHSNRGAQHSMAV